MLLENPGPIMLHASRIRDRTLTDDLQAAAVSPPLLHPVARIEVSAMVFKDQGWGNTKSQLFLTLFEGEEVLVRHGLWGVHRQDLQDESPPKLILEHEDLVTKAQPGTVLRMEYSVGGGGGHRIEVVDWICALPEPLDGLTESLRQDSLCEFNLC